MRMLIKNIFWSFCSVMFFSLIFLSCNKDNEESGVSGVQLLSFGPTGVKPGEEIKFIGHNLDRVSAIEFAGTGAVVEKTSFKSQSSSLITLIVPQAAERGRVTLKTSDGDIVSKAMFDLGVGATVTAITNEARPGANITISGTYLNWVTSVTFSDDLVVTQFVSKSFDELVVKVPDSAKSGALVIAYSGTEADDFETEQLLNVTLPRITALAPAQAKHADNITLTGTNMDLVKKIYFNNVATAVTQFVSQSATQIVVKVPGATTKGVIKLEAASGVQTQSPGELDILMPAITNLSPNPVDPGANLTITGTNLSLVTGIMFENITNAVTTFVSQSATQIVVKVPSGIANGLVTLLIVNSSLNVKSPNILQIAGAAPPPTIAMHIYNDAVVNWSGWVGDGWGGTKDYNNPTPVRVGTKSIKVVYTGTWGAPIQLGSGNLNIAPYTMFKLSIYATAETAGMNVTVQFNGSGGYSLKLGKAGEWTDHAIPISSITSATKVTDIIIQNNSVSGTIYIDEMGFN